MPDDKWENASGVWENISHMIELEKKKIKLLEQVGEMLVAKRENQFVMLGLKAPDWGWTVDRVKGFYRAYTQAVKEGHQHFVFPTGPNGVEYEIHYAYYLLSVLKRKLRDDWRISPFTAGLAPPPVINKEEKPT